MKDFLIKEKCEYTFCMFCGVFSKVSVQTEKFIAVLETVQNRVVGLERVIGQDASDTSVVPLVKEADVYVRYNSYKTGLHVLGNNAFQLVGRGAGSRQTLVTVLSLLKICSTYWKTRFMISQSSCSRGDSLNRH